MNKQSDDYTHYSNHLFHENSSSSYKKYAWILGHSMHQNSWCTMTNHRFCYMELFNRKVCCARVAAISSPKKVSFDACNTVSQHTSTCKRHKTNTSLCNSHARVSRSQCGNKNLVSKFLGLPAFSLTTWLGSTYSKKTTFHSRLQYVGLNAYLSKISWY